jgi:hypothetical protein
MYSGRVIDVAPSGALAGGWSITYDSATDELVYAASALAGSESATVALGSVSGWRHVAVERDAALGELIIRLDGAEAVRDAPCTSADTTCNLVVQGSYTLGAAPDSDLWGGHCLDELRLGDQPRSPDALLADYLSARDPATTISLGAEQAR